MRLVRSLWNQVGRAFLRERGRLARIHLKAGGTPALPWRLASLLTLLTAIAHAQSVRWEPTESGMSNSVALVYENCTPDGQPDLPVIPGLTFTSLGRSESMNMINFQTTRSVTLTYLIRGRQSGPVQIPAFTVKTDKGPQRVAAFNAAAPAAPLESVASSKLIPERTSVWTGEVFSLNYELSASRRANPQISPTFDWNAAPLVAEDWSKPEVNESVVGGERRVNVLFRTRVAAKSSNTLKLEAAGHLLSIQTGTIGFGIISQPRMEQVSVVSDQPTIEVRPLPTAPAGFNGAVGQFKLTSKIVPEKAAVGEPVTWTLELSGTGNWPDIAGLPAREVSNDFQVVQPKAKRTPVEGKLFDVTLAEDVVLVPGKAGAYTLGPVSFVYFDPKTGSYKTVTAPRTSVTITAPKPPQFSITTAPEVAAVSIPPVSAKPAIPPSAPPTPTAIPRDPLLGAAEAGVPMANRTLVVCLLVPLAVLILFWCWLAVRRAKQTDPVRPRREARDRIARTLGELALARSPSGSQRSTLNAQLQQQSLLLQWQHDAAILWSLAQAAPRATAIPDSTWTTLWSEADRALYGADSALPSDWIARAQLALAAKRVPGFQPLRLFLPQNLMPFAALIACFLAASPAWLRAADLDAAAAYRKGDFVAAEKTWRAAIERTPTNWIARHNLSLTLAQQDRAGEAAAQAAAAFVQNPDDPSVRWHFALAAEKAGTAPATLTRFITPGPLHSLGRVVSPANWQWTMIGAAWATAAAIGWLLFESYGRRVRLIRRTAIVLGIAGLGTIGAAAAGIYSYGLAANSNAVIVMRPGTLRSIPTEADTTQKTSALAAGSMALSGKTFLGWTQLVFENGQTGWVRKDDLVPLWR